MTRPLLIGDAPPLRRVTAAPFDGATSARILRLMGATPPNRGTLHNPCADLRRLFDVASLCAETWTFVEAAAGAARHRSRPVAVLLGTNVADAALVGERLRGSWSVRSVCVDWVARYLQELGRGRRARVVDYSDWRRSNPQAPAAWTLQRHGGWTAVRRDAERLVANNG